MWRRLLRWWLRLRNDETPQHLRTGEWGEWVATRFLKRQGYRILGRRVRMGRGELDIVAREGEQLVFVEVKTRALGGAMRPAEAVDRRKRRLLAKAGGLYLRRVRGRVASFRFDIVEVEGRTGDTQPIIHHIKRAFDAKGAWR